MQQAVGIFDFQAREAHEISFLKGASMRVTDTEEGRRQHPDWLEVEIDGRQGLVPANHIRVLHLAASAPAPAPVPESNLKSNSSATSALASSLLLSVDKEASAASPSAGCSAQGGLFDSDSEADEDSDGQRRATMPASDRGSESATMCVPLATPAAVQVRTDAAVPGLFDSNSDGDDDEVGGATAGLLNDTEMDAPLFGEDQDGDDEDEQQIGQTLEQELEQGLEQGVEQGLDQTSQVEQEQVREQTQSQALPKERSHVPQAQLQPKLAREHEDVSGIAQHPEEGKGTLGQGKALEGATEVSSGLRP